MLILKQVFTLYQYLFTGFHFKIYARETRNFYACSDFFDKHKGTMSRKNAKGQTLAVPPKKSWLKPCGLGVLPRLLPK